ncbi:MAG: glycosyltransferase family 4 protein [Kiritimatiellales bacterium]|nr:glycosyltransferase family 4 protein [Kiritimatiellota bacterium]MBL7015970.1 glycosyltransferase family 4 protein [Kiritimatiellales bacterium]
MNLAFAHHLDLGHSAQSRKPGAVGIHSAAENIALHLEEVASGFQTLAPLRNICNPLAAARIALCPRITREKYYGWAEPSLSRGYGRQLSNKMKHFPADAVLCTEVKHAAYLNTDRPVAVWTDSLYGGLADYYQTFTGLSKRTLSDLRAMDRAAVENCERLIFASDWAAQKAIELYGADPEKVKVAPYGANLTSGLNRAEAEMLVNAKPMDGICRLLFTGVEWKRKGGDTAVQVAEQLIARGIKTEITVLGTDPHQHMDSVPDFVNCAGFLSLNKPDELAKMKQLYSEAHVLLQPCRAECFGHVFPEANSFALPAIASNTGGIPTAVQDGINGYCVDVGDVDAYAGRITTLYNNPDEYRTLCLRAFDDYHAHLSWRQAAGRVVHILEKL